MNIDYSNNFSPTALRKGTQLKGVNSTIAGYPGRLYTEASALIHDLFCDVGEFYTGHHAMKQKTVLTNALADIFKATQAKSAYGTTPKFLFFDMALSLAPNSPHSNSEKWTLRFNQKNKTWSWEYQNH